MNDSHFPIISTNTAVGGTLVSFFVASLPILQWTAALIAAIAGVFAIVVHVKNLNRDK